MKKALITLLAIGTATSLFAASGEVNFNNTGNGVNAPVSDTNGTKLSGTGFFAQLYSASPGSGVFTAQGSPTPFRTGAAAGFWVSTVPTVNNANSNLQADIQARAWQGPGGSWESATVRGESNVLSSFQLSGGAPATPPPMTGLQAFTISQVPEPATLTLGALAAASLLFRRRRQNQTA